MVPIEVAADLVAVVRPEEAGAGEGVDVKDRTSGLGHLLRDVRDDRQPLFDAGTIAVLGLSPGPQGQAVSQQHVSRVECKWLVLRQADGAAVHAIDVTRERQGARRNRACGQNGNGEVRRDDAVEIGIDVQHDRKRRRGVAAGRDALGDEIRMCQDQARRRTGVCGQLVMVDHARSQIIADIEVEPGRSVPRGLRLGSVPNKLEADDFPIQRVASIESGDAVVFMVDLLPLIVGMPSPHSGTTVCSGQGGARWRVEKPRLGGRGSAQFYGAPVPPLDVTRGIHRQDAKTPRKQGHQLVEPDNQPVSFAVFASSR